jgi:hypothetical protein
MKMPSHRLFKKEDFTAEEIERRNILAIGVVEQALKSCKICGATGNELDTYPSCEEFRKSERREAHLCFEGE